MRRLLRIVEVVLNQLQTCTGSALVLALTLTQSGPGYPAQARALPGKATVAITDVTVVDE